MSEAAPRKLLQSFARREHPLALADVQRAVLRRVPLASTFEAAVRTSGHTLQRAGALETLQINVGKRCNQTCEHCHVDAGPDRREVMPDAVVEAVLALLERTSVTTLDITGGAPEMHPRFREIVRRARTLGRRVIDRCNLTITSLPNYADLHEFFAAEGVEIVASLPWHHGTQTDAQRGDGVFELSIDALRRLNALGYGDDESGLVLHLVTNPVGAYLPSAQALLEREWKRELSERFGVRFNRLFTVTNMPISRYLAYLQDSGQLEAYMAKLVASFNPCAIQGLMCRTMLSVGHDGALYDCDFNQMLELPLDATVFDLDPTSLGARAIRTDVHCFGCTAGAGSSCGGATT